MPVLQTPTVREWLAFGGLLLSLFLLLRVADWLLARQRLHAGIIRKTVHLVSGLLMILSPVIFDSSIPLLLLAIIFVIVNSLAIRFDHFRGIHTTGSRSYGTVFYPLSFLILVLAFWQRDVVAMLAGVSVLAIADLAAAIAGHKAAQPKFLKLPGDRKTLQGSAAMFIVSAVLVALIMTTASRVAAIDMPALKIVQSALGVAALATAGEALSWRGSDNLSVPLLTAFSTHVYLQASPEVATQFLWGTLLALLAALWSYRLGFLDFSGALMTLVLGAIVFGLGGWKYSLPLVVFFVPSSLLSRLLPARKQRATEDFQKGGSRDVGQVLANGGIAGLLVILSHWFPGGRWYPLYLGAVAAVTADTWATEIGLLSRRAPRLITTLRRVAPGTSGALSTLGLLGAACGSAVIAGTGIAFEANVFSRAALVTALMITISGIIGHLFDSLLGATVQAQQLCTRCQRITEKKGQCCGTGMVRYSGVRWIDNDVVNSGCALGGVLSALIAFHFIQD